MTTIKITAELTPAEEGGYVVYCPELDITTEGETVEEAVYMLKDAANGYVDVVGLENIPHFAKAGISREKLAFLFALLMH